MVASFLLCLFMLEPFYFIHYSDPQIGRNASALPNVQTAVAQIDAMDPPARFILVAGDMGNNPGNQSMVLNQWQICDSLFDLLPMPKYYAPGNNDVGYEDEGCWTPAMLQFYRNFWGPDYYSFDEDSCHFIALNSTLLDTYSGHPCYPYSLEQDSFLRNDLQSLSPGEYKHLFFFFHFPLYQSSPYDPNGHSVVDRPRRDTLLSNIQRYDVASVFTGHWHVNYINFYWPALLQTGIATCVGSSSAGYRAVKVFSNGIETFSIPLLAPIDTLSLVNIVTASVDPDTVYVNTPVSFNCFVDSSNFPEWTDLSYKWKFGDSDSSMSSNTTHIYADTGQYQVVFVAYHLHEKCALYKFNILVVDDQHVQEERYPNIASPQITIPLFQNCIDLELPEAGELMLDMYQVDGQLYDRVYKGYLARGRHRIQIDADIPAGVYFVRFSFSGYEIIHKYVRIR